jgi:L,D-peptidoglycan transpeptidase YkuD (ErfK/YbiS/YcfS/YnhG family)
VSRHFKSVALALVVLLAAVACVAGARPSKPLPARLAHVGNARQVLIVQNPTFGGHHATIQGWERDAHGRWRQVIATQRANLGLNGLTQPRRRHEGDHRTPEGTYRLTFAFGYRHDPGARLPYKRLDRSDYWAGDPRDPRTYNLFQGRHPSRARWRTSHAEHLVAMRPAYRYAINIDWNLPRGVHRTKDGQRIASRPAHTRRGYAIFLHTFGTTGPNGYTLGCIAIKPRSLVRILRWLRPGLHPKIVIGTTSDITHQ